jgi:uncharacterized membrane protein (UPF0127 family)
MLKVVARNVDTGRLIAEEVSVAATRLARAAGLLFRDALAPAEALWVVPSHGVHTWGLRFPIDLIALDEGGVVIDRATHLGPWRLRLPRPGTSSVLELAAGRLDASQTRLGDRVVFEVTDHEGETLSL